MNTHSCILEQELKETLKSLNSTSSAKVKMILLYFKEE